MKAKKKSYKKLKTELDRVFSLYIRNRDGGVCFTCKKKGAIKEMQNGHFFSRTYLATRWDPKNCHCQCVGCNIFRKGNMAVYAKRMLDKYGASVFGELELKTKVITKLSSAELETMIDMYK